MHIDYRCRPCILSVPDDSEGLCSSDPRFLVSVILSLANRRKCATHHAQTGSSRVQILHASSICAQQRPIVPELCSGTVQTATTVRRKCMHHPSRTGTVPQADERAVSEAGVTGSADKPDVGGVRAQHTTDDVSTKRFQGNVQLTMLFMTDGDVDDLRRRSVLNATGGRVPADLDEETENALRKNSKRRRRSRRFVVRRSGHVAPELKTTD